MHPRKSLNLEERPRCKGQGEPEEGAWGQGWRKCPWPLGLSSQVWWPGALPASASPAGPLLTQQASDHNVVSPLGSRGKGLVRKASMGTRRAFSLHMTNSLVSGRSHLSAVAVGIELCRVPVSTAKAGDPLVSGDRPNPLPACGLRTSLDSALLRRVRA